MLKNIVLVAVFSFSTWPSLAALGPYWGRVNLIKKIMEDPEVAAALEKKDIQSIQLDPEHKVWHLSTGPKGCFAVVSAKVKSPPVNASGEMIIGAGEYDLVILESTCYEPSDDV